METHESGENIFRFSAFFLASHIFHSIQTDFDGQQKTKIEKSKKREKYGKTLLRTVIHLSVPLSGVCDVCVPGCVCGCVPT